jgi:hypothetical protein
LKGFVVLIAIFVCVLVVILVVVLIEAQLAALVNHVAQLTTAVARLAEAMKFRKSD